MKSQRELLTPQMLRYDDFDDRAETRYLPYLMYFHRADYRSATINTDRLGFRISHGATEQGSVANPPKGPVRLLAGSSTPFGIGATADAATMASRLWTRYAPSVPWLNFAGRSHNSMQELLLFLMHREQVPEVDEIVVFSGLNDLALSRLPDAQRGDHGGFFNCGEYFDSMDELRASHRKPKRGFGRRPGGPEDAPHVVPPLADRIAYAVDLTSRHLAALRLLAGPTGARITYVLQPLATWVRESGPSEERAIFGEPRRDLQLLGAVRRHRHAGDRPPVRRRTPGRLQGTGHPLPGPEPRRRRVRQGRRLALCGPGAFHRPRYGNRLRAARRIPRALLTGPVSGLHVFPLRKRGLFSHVVRQKPHRESVPSQAEAQERRLHLPHVLTARDGERGTMHSQQAAATATLSAEHQAGRPHGLPGDGGGSARTVYAYATDPEASLPEGRFVEEVRTVLRRHAAAPGDGSPDALDALVRQAADWGAGERERYLGLAVGGEGDGDRPDGHHQVLVRRAVLGCAPLALMSGAWLQWLSAPGNADDPLVLRLLTLYASDVGPATRRPPVAAPTSNSYAGCGSPRTRRRRPGSPATSASRTGRSASRRCSWR